MNFAINYSQPAAALVSSGTIDIDAFKCPDWPDMIEQALKLRPVAVHFTLRAGTGELLTTADWPLVERLMRLTGTPYINLHLDPTINDFLDASGGVPADTQDPAHFRQVTDILIQDVLAVTTRFGPERVIAENVPYRGAQGKVLRPAVEPDVIRSVLEETGCGLLLDISHARIAARHLGLDESAYLDSLPLERLRELHITGLHTVSYGWQDHLPMLAEDWPWVDRAVEAVQNGVWGPAWLLAFEYGGEGGWFEQHTEAGVIAEQVPELWKKIKLGGSSR
jgi:uncharacterized protein (UPF0276 family)